MTCSLIAQLDPEAEKNTLWTEFELLALDEKIQTDQLPIQQPSRKRDAQLMSI